MKTVTKILISLLLSFTSAYATVVFESPDSGAVLSPGTTSFTMQSHITVAPYDPTLDLFTNIDTNGGVNGDTIIYSQSFSINTTSDITHIKWYGDTDQGVGFMVLLHDSTLITKVIGGFTIGGTGVDAYPLSNQLVVTQLQPNYYSYDLTIPKFTLVGGTNYNLIIANVTGGFSQWHWGMSTSAQANCATSTNCRINSRAMSSTIGSVNLPSPNVSFTLYNDNISITPIAPVINTSTISNATVNTLYTYPISVTAQNPYTITTSILPTGLSFDGTNITGTPTISGSFNIQITVVDNINNLSTTNTIVLNILPASTPIPSPTPVPTISCSGTMSLITNVVPGKGGINPVLGWVEINGGANNQFNGGTIVYFAPQANTTFSPGTTYGIFPIGGYLDYTGIVDATFGCIANTMNVNPKISLITSTLSNGIVGSLYSTPITVMYGLPPYQFNITGIPTGLSFDGTNITGTPTISGISTISISVNDVNNVTTTNNLSLIINPSPTPVPTVTPTPMPTATPIPVCNIKSIIEGKGTIKSISDNIITLEDGKVLDVSCAKVEWNRKTHIYKIGDDVEYHGEDNTIINTNNITLN